MANKDDKLISAQVVLNADSATEPQAVIEEFARAGFEVGQFFGNSFSITAPSKKFETYFHVKLKSPGQEGMQVKASESSVSSDLPLKALPGRAKNQVEAILFSKPPDFGPGGNY